MQRVLISFLGLGNKKTPPDGPYGLAVYGWEGKKSVETRFAQVAIVELLGAFDRVVVLCSRESRKFLEFLKADLAKIHHFKSEQFVSPSWDIPTEMTPENQWGWFENLLSEVAPGDRVTFDFTHGMRAVPIVFSSAIGFLRQARGISLEHALYAWYDSESKSAHPLVDMRDFYAIQDWAESVSRLTEDADAKKLATLASENKTIEALDGLGDEELIQAFTEMTDCIRNVDVNNVAPKLRKALDVVERHRRKTTGAAALLLDLVSEKFRVVAVETPTSGLYDETYFTIQLAIIDVLIEHRLYMQAFTAMRECVGSLGMVGLQGKYAKKMTNADGRRYRKRFAEVFVNMLQYEQEKWKFQGQQKDDCDHLISWFDKLKRAEIEKQLRGFVSELIRYRNGFDHAWTSSEGADADIQEKADKFRNELFSSVKSALALLS